MNLRKPESAHCFFACSSGACRNTGAVFIYSAWMCVGTSFSQKVFYSGIEALRSLSVIVASAYIIDFCIGTMPPLVKRHCRSDKDSVGICPDAVEHGSYISVIPYIVSTPSVDRNCGVRNQILTTV